MKKELSLVEILGLAIRSEEDAMSFYGKVVSLIKNDIVRTKYLSLAEEEGRHRKLLASLYCRVTGERMPPKRIQGRPMTAEGGVSFRVSTLDDAIGLAIEREASAEKFYRDSAKAIKEDEAAKNILSYLADMEHGHFLMLKAELKAYLRDKNFYAENPDIQLVG